MAFLQKAKALAKSTMTMPNVYEVTGLTYYANLGSRTPGQYGAPVMVGKRLIILSGLLIGKAVAWKYKGELAALSEDQRKVALEQKAAAIPWTSEYWQYFLPYPSMPHHLVNAAHIARGDGDSLESRCWEQVLGPTQVKSLDPKQRKIYEENGMLLGDVAKFSGSEVYSVGEHNTLVMKTKEEKYFAFQIIEDYPAGTCRDTPNDTFALYLIHPVEVKIVD